MPSCCVSDILGNTPVYVARAALYTAVTDRLRGVDTPVEIVNTLAAEHCSYC